MADIAILRINYKSDFILTLNSDAGWMTPFCIKFWTGAPSQAYFVGFDGTTYTHCAPVDGKPTKLRVQFDDHHLPIGDLKFQIGYHFTVADFPTNVEDEVLNQASVIIEVDDAPAQVMLDLNGETAPEIEFSLPAYANEAQRIANEEERIAHEQQRIANEDTRIQAEETRQQNEAQRIDQETARVNEFATLKSQSQAATRDANAAATLANEKAQLAADKAALADDAATLAIQKAQLAADKAALANDAAQLAADKAALAHQKAEYAQQQGSYAKDQGDYAKSQGNYAKEQGEIVQADHERAETDHGIAVDDHTQAGNDHTRAEADHGIAADDHTQAGNDHTRAESDHTRAESDHAAVEPFVDSLGAFDISAYHATGGVLAKYADLTAALGTNGANIPEALRKGGMSVKYVQSSDNKYIQARCMAQNFTTDVTQWQGVDEEPTPVSNNLVKSGGVEARLNKGLINDITQFIDFANLEMEIGAIDPNTGQNMEQSGTRRPVGYIPITKKTYYYLMVTGTSSAISSSISCNIFFYDENKDFISNSTSYSARTVQNTTQKNASFIRFTTSVNNSVDTIHSWCLVDRPSYNKIVERGSFYNLGVNAATRFAPDISFSIAEPLKLISLSNLRRAGLLTFKSKNICNPQKAIRGGSVEYDGLITRETYWETSLNYLQVIDSIDPNTQYTIKSLYASTLFWYDENDHYIGSEIRTSTTYTTISPSNAYILRFKTNNSPTGIVCLGDTLFNVDYQDGYIVKQELLPGNASGNYDFSNYVYEAIGDSRTAGYAINTNYNNNGEISSWPESPVDGYYQIMTDGTYNGIAAEAGDGIVYSNGSTKLIKGGYSYVTELGKIAIWPQGDTYPQIIHERTGIVMSNHAYPGAAFCKRPQVPGADSVTAYNQALQISAATNVVTIFMGVNDRIIDADPPSLTTGSSNTRDNAENKYDVLTFKGAIRQTIKNIRLIAPMAMIVFINENDGSQGYDGGSSKAQMIEEVAEEYRLPVLNLCKCGVNPEQDIEYLDTKYQSRTDTLHESTVGHDFLARAVGGEIKKYLW